MNEGPLSKTALAEIRREVASLAACRIKIEKARRAGLDVTEQEARCHHLQQSLQQLLEVYAPNLSAAAGGT